MVRTTMKAYLWIIVLLCGCLAKKEELGELSDMLKNPGLKEKLIQEIQKRLQDDTKPMCPYKSNSTTIIRTTESLRAGAKFLKNAVVITSEECVMECCQLKTCNVAVFKDKKKSSCYLFDCGDQRSKCLFAEDDGFTVMFPSNHPATITSSEQSDKHASDLENLAPPKPKEIPTTTTSTTTTTVKPTTKKPTTTTTTTMAPTHREPVPLFGPCRSDKDCAGSSTECLAGYCVCMDGFHAQDGVCTPKNGPRPGFNTQRKGPSLNIGNKDQSAGQTHGMGDKDQSADNKPPVIKPAEPDNSQQPGQSQNPNNRWQHQGNMGGPPPNPNDNREPFHPPPQPTMRPPPGKQQHPGGRWPQNPNQGQGDHGQRPQRPIHQGQGGPNDKDQGQQGGRPGHWRQPSGSNQPGHGRGHKINRLPPDTQGPNNKAGVHKGPINIHSSPPKKVIYVPTVPNTQHPEDKKPKTKPPAENRDQENKDTSQGQGNDTAKVEAVGQRQEIDKAEKGQFYSMESNQGAVIALAMGLAVTALLLVFVGCRLRNVKKRLRRGRALHSNEADYLINGMYL